MRFLGPLRGWRVLPSHPQKPNWPHVEPVSMALASTATGGAIRMLIVRCPVEPLIVRCDAETLTVQCDPSPLTVRAED